MVMLCDCPLASRCVTGLPIRTPSSKPLNTWFYGQLLRIYGSDLDPIESGLRARYTFRDTGVRVTSHKDNLNQLPLGWSEETKAAGHTTDEAVLLLRDYVVGEPVTISANSVDKGENGRWLQQLLDVSHGPGARDLSDGELKTVKTKVIRGSEGWERVHETIAIGLVPKRLEDVRSQEVIDRVLGKLSNTVILERLEFPDGSQRWGALYRFDGRQHYALMHTFAKDFNRLCDHLTESAEAYGSIHTAHATYLEVRTKDSKPYTPTYYKGEEVSDKRRAFYLSTSALKSIHRKYRAVVVADVALEELYPWPAGSAPMS